MENMALQIFSDVFVIAASLTCAEVLKGYFAYLLGDRKGYIERRFTTNPLELIDFLGTIIVPLIFSAMGSIASHSPFLVFFAWCIPIKIDYHNMYFGRIGAFLAYLSDPLTHIIMSVICFILLYFSVTHSLAQMVFTTGWGVNAVLAALSCLPILPYAGGQITRLLLPYQLRVIYARHEPFSFLILLFLLLLLRTPQFEFLKIYFYWFAFLTAKIGSFILWL